jgi:tetratricopeptide (TPR) repeat protein
VTAQLVRISDGRTLWADNFDEPLNGIFALQDSVAEQIARTLAVQIDTGRGNLTLTRRYSENAEAYESYLMGYFFWNKRTRENVAKAIPYLERAVEQDPDFALARALLADCHLIDVFYNYYISPASESSEKARAEASKALALNDSIAESHIVMAQVKSLLEGDWAGAETEYKRGLALNPNYATGRIRYGFELFFSLRLEDAIREVKRGRELDPLSPAANSALSFMLIMAHDYDAAIQYGRKAVEFNPELIMPRVNLGEDYLHKGMYREAFDEFKRLEQYDAVRGRLCLAHANARAGQQDKARALLAQLQRSPDARSLSALDFAGIYAALGEGHEALGILEKASLNMQDLALLHFDPQWDALRSDQRFEALVKRGRQR